MQLRHHAGARRRQPAERQVAGERERHDAEHHERRTRNVIGAEGHAILGSAVTPLAPVGARCSQLPSPHAKHGGEGSGVGGRRLAPPRRSSPSRPRRSRARHYSRSAARDSRAPARSAVRCRIARQSRSFVVLPAVKLDDEARGVAGEIREVRSDRRLTAEVRACDRQMAQMLPEHALGVGRLVTHLPRAGNARVTVSLGPSLLQEPPTPDPSPPLAALAGEGSRSAGALSLRTATPERERITRTLTPPPCRSTAPRPRRAARRRPRTP